MTNHERSILKIKIFLLNQLIDNKKKEMELSISNPQNAPVHLMNVVSYSRKINKINQELNSMRHNKLSGADYRSIE